MTSAARIKALAEETVKAFAVRPARPEDCGDIAMLFLLSSGGLAEYIWSQAGPEGASPLETGRRRYAREGVAFSYQNCLVAEEDGLAMLHSFVMPPREETGDEAAANDNDNGEAVDPVLQPYAELEDPGSLYVSGVAVTPEHRGRGLGGKLMAQARARAEALDLPRVSLICFEANETAMQLIPAPRLCGGRPPPGGAPSEPALQRRRRRAAGARPGLSVQGTTERPSCPYRTPPPAPRSPHRAARPSCRSRSARSGRPRPRYRRH